MDTMGLSSVVQTLEKLAAEHGDRFAPAAVLTKMAKKNETFF